MNERLLEPLKYYETEGRATHEQNVNAYFDNLVSKSGINVEANRTIVKEYNKENHLQRQGNVHGFFHPKAQHH